MMTIDDLRQRIILNTMLAAMSDRYEAHKLFCDVVVDGMKLCAKKIEAFVKEGTTKEKYNEVADTWRTCAESAQKVAESTPRDKGCRQATDAMLIAITLIAATVTGLPEKIPFHDAPPVKEKSEHEKKQEEVDRILDKISAQGIGSLTQQEKDTLANFSKS